MISGPEPGPPAQSPMPLRHLLEISDLSPAELARVLALSDPADLVGALGSGALAGGGVGLVFEKPSARTRHSMEMAVVQLGGHPAYITGSEVGLDQRESVEDVTRTLACYYAVVGARVFNHRTIERMAALDVAPVINLLSDRSHPMQALADLLTLQQEWGQLAGRTVAYVGDGNNVCRSLALGAAMSGVELRVASPSGYNLTDHDADAVAALGGQLCRCNDPREAVAGADAVYTDVWVSMGEEGAAATKRDALGRFGVTAQLMAEAAPGAIFLHCLPAHRGEEVSAEVIDGPRSRVWRQAANRMHAARGLLRWLVEANAPGNAAAAPLRSDGS
ncbi:MAG: ornithine carbamoyltransferase [Acidimicrobiales bacterium]